MCMFKCRDYVARSVFLSLQIVPATESEYVSPLENFLVNTSKTDVNDASFILSIWINGCRSKYPTNVASMEHIHKYYTNRNNTSK